MIKKLLGSIFAVGIFLALSSVHAGEACCAKGAKNQGKKGCSISYAKLNLSAEQKSKLEAVEAECRRDCTEAHRAKFMNTAKEILSAEQFTQLKAECDKAQATPKTQS